MTEESEQYWFAEAQELKDTNAELLEALEQFVNAKSMTGWNEGDCDMWLGPIWHVANEAIQKGRA